MKKRTFGSTRRIQLQRMAGLNHRTESLDEAIAFDLAQGEVLAAIDAAEAAARIERRISDESGEFTVWVVHENSSPTPDAGNSGSLSL